MTSCNFPCTVHVLFAILVRSCCLEYPRAPKFSWHDKAVCTEVELQETEHDAVVLLQKAAILVQRQLKETQSGSGGSLVESSDTWQFTKTLGRVDAQRNGSVQQAWTRWPRMQAGMARTHSGTRSLISASVIGVADKAQMQIKLPDLIALLCVGIFLIAIAIRIYISSEGTDVKHQIQNSLGLAEQTAANGGVEDSEAQEDQFRIAKVMGLLVSGTDFNDAGMLALLPAYCVDRGMSKTQAGLCFSAFGIVPLVFAPIVPYIVSTPRIRKLVLWTGLRSYAASRLPFMLLVFVPDSILFPVLFVILAFAGFTQVLYLGGAYAWTFASVAPKDRTAAVALMSSGRLFGAMLGPSVGGILYSIDGLTIPVVVGFIAFTLLVEYFKDMFSGIDPAVHDNEDEPHSRNGTILRLPGVVVCGLSLIVVSAMTAGNVAWLQLLFEQKYHVPTWGWGLMAASFLFIMACSMIVLVPTCEKFFGTYMSSLLGITLASMSYLIVGPSPWLPFLPTTQLWLPILGCAIYAVAVAFPAVIYASLATNIAIAAGWNENDVAAQLACVEVVVSACGTAFGPAVYMAVTQACGLRGMTNYIFVGTFAVLSCLWIILRWLNPPAATGDSEN